MHIKIIKKNPFNNNIIIPNNIDLDSFPIIDIYAIYEPKTQTRKFGTNIKITIPSKHYLFSCKGIQYGEQLILLPRNFQKKSEYQEIFGHYQSKQQLYATRKFPILKRNEFIIYSQ